MKRAGGVEKKFVVVRELDALAGDFLVGAGEAQMADTADTLRLAAGLGLNAFAATGFDPQLFRPRSGTKGKRRIAPLEVVISKDEKNRGGWEQ